MANRLEATKNGAAAPEKNGAGGHEEDEAPIAKGGGGKGGASSWLPLILNVVLMPAIAFGMTQFYLIPKLKASTSSGAQAESSAAESSHGEEKHGGGGGGEKGKYTVPLGAKILVNVAGSMGTRYLVASISVLGTSSDLKSMMEGRDAQLRDAASGILSNKTIADLEKPGIRNLVRTELLSAFNDILGKKVITEIYLTEFAIQ